MIYIKQEPQQYQPVYNKITYIVDSDNKSECDFQYVADLYVNGSLVIRLTTQKDSVYGYGVFEIDQTLSKYVSYDLWPNLEGFTGNPNSICDYYLEFREEYDTSTYCNGGTTVSAIMETSGIKYAWNGALQEREFLEYDENTFITDDSSARFLTNAPNSLLIGVHDKFNLNYINKESFEVTAAEVKTYDINGNLLNTFRYDVSGEFTAADETYKHIVSFGCGPNNLNTLAPNSGSLPVIDNDTHTYTIQLKESTNYVSEIKTFEIDRKCSVFVNKRFWFLNRLGGFDSYSYKLKSRRNIQIDRLEYYKNSYAITLSSPDYFYTRLLSERGKTLLSVRASENFNYNSDWMSENESIWMEELFTSPEVYLGDNFQATEIAVTDVTCDIGSGDNIKLKSVTTLITGEYYTYDFSGLDSLLGIDSTGFFEITGTSGGGFYETDLPCTTGGVGFSGIIYLERYTMELMPVIVTDNNYEEKIKSNIKNINYTINVKPSYNINIQSN